MSTVPFETHASVTDDNDASGAWTCAKLAITGVAVTGFWVFAFFILIPALFGK
jgi:hypothetical protein